MLEAGSPAAQQSTCSPLRCIHTPHVWSPTLTTLAYPTSSYARACATVCLCVSHRPQSTVYRAYLRVPLSMGTGPYVLWIRTCRFPSSCPPRGPTSLPYSFLRSSFLFHPVLSFALLCLSISHSLSVSLLLLLMPLCLTPLPSTINLVSDVRALFPLSCQLCFIDRLSRDTDFRRNE